MASGPGLTVMVPLGGIGSRFQKEGYTRPKPFVSVLGKPMILWVLDSLKLGPNDSLVIVYNPGWMSPKYWEAVVASYPKVHLVTLPGPTRGAAETVLIGLRGMPKALRTQPVMLVDGDAFYEEDIVSMYRSIAPTSNGVFYFLDTQPKPLYSYIVFEPSTRRITQVKEKVKISDHANSGCYCFMSGTELAAQCHALLESNRTQLSQDAVGEFYTSGVIGAMIEEGQPFPALQVDPAKFHVLGTPEQLVSWCVAQKSPNPQRICFDLDHTLVTAPRVAGDYSTCEPLHENIAALKVLHAQGHTIIILTGRRMRTHQGNVGAVVADIGATTIESLRKYGIPYHELCFGKPYAQFYIDDLAVSAFADLHKELGFYPGSQHTAKPKKGGAAASVASAAAALPAADAPWKPLLLAALLGAGAGALLSSRLRK